MRLIYCLVDKIGKECGSTVKKKQEPKPDPEPRTPTKTNERSDLFSPSKSPSTLKRIGSFFKRKSGKDGSSSSKP